MNEDDLVEKILGNRSKVRIIRYLGKVFEANITRIVKATRMHYVTVRRNLEELKNLGIVEEKQVGRVKIYSLNFSNPVVRIILEAINLLEYEK